MIIIIFSYTHIIFYMPFSWTTHKYISRNVLLTENNFKKPHSHGQENSASYYSAGWNGRDIIKETKNSQKTACLRNVLVLNRDMNIAMFINIWAIIVALEESNEGLLASNVLYSTWRDKLEILNLFTSTKFFITFIKSEIRAHDCKL